MRIFEAIRWAAMRDPSFQFMTLIECKKSTPSNFFYLMHGVEIVIALKIPEAWTQGLVWSSEDDIPF